MNSGLKINSGNFSKFRSLIFFCFLFILTSIFNNSFSQAPEGAHKLASEFIKVREPSLKSTPANIFNQVTDFEDIWIFERYSPKTFVLVKKEKDFQVAGYSLTNTFLKEGELTEPGILFLRALQDISLTDHYQNQRFKSYPPSIAPLTETKWNQDCFFNHACPTDYRGYCDHVPVGCVPVAMGQIIRYYGRFNKFILEEKFESTDYPDETVVLGNYDWDLMEDDPICIDHEVSRFLYHLGVISKVRYSHDVTSTSTYNAWVAFGKMGYLESVRMTRGLTNRETWIDAFYKNISEFMPVYVAGGGHAFVCDGYEPDGFFHFNLGWGGSADGFYPLIGTGSPIISEALMEIRPHSLVLPPVNLQYIESSETDSLVWSPHPFAEVAPFKYRIYQDEIQFAETFNTSFAADVFDHGKHKIKVSAWYVNGESRWTGPIEVFKTGIELNIPDQNLRKSMNISLGYEGEEAELHMPRTDELIEVKQIKVDQPLTNLQGIEYCPGLTELVIMDNQGSEFDLRKLTSNKYLKILKVTNAQMGNLEDLSNFKNLVYLTLDNTPVPSTDFLGSTKGILNLSLRNSILPSLDSIRTLEHLEYLNLSNTGLNDAFFVDQLETIKQIDLSHNNLDDFELTNTLSKLRFLNLSGNSLTDMKFTERALNLVSLELGNNQLSSLELFKTYGNLNYIGLADNDLQLIKINHLQPQLKKLVLSENQINDIDRLVEFAPVLEHLEIDDNEIAVLWTKSIQSLNYLDVSGNKLKTIEDIQLNPSLRHLDISDNVIGDFYPLVRIDYHESLDFLNITGNPGSKESFHEFYPKFLEHIDTTFIDDTFNPYCPSYPLPLRENNLIANTINLNWEAESTEDIIGYDLYFGKPDSLELIGNMLNEKQFDVEVDRDQRYEWQVISHKQDTSFTSGIFNFRTFPPLELPFFDDFESYQVNNRISIESPHWVTINQNYNSVDDGMVVNFRHYSGEKALKMLGNAHLFLPVDNFIGDVLIVECALLVPKYNVACMRITDISGIKLEIYFKVNEVADILVNEKVVSSFQYSVGQWIPVKLSMNGNREQLNVYVEGRTHFKQNWKYPNSKVEIENVEFSGEKSPNFPSDGYPLFYLDDLKIRELVTVSTDPIELSIAEIKVYPNPANDEFWIHYDEESIISNLQLINIHGQRIMEIPFNQGIHPKRVITSNLKPGLYWLSYTTQNGPEQVKIIITP